MIIALCIGTYIIGFVIVLKVLIAIEFWEDASDVLPLCFFWPATVPFLLLTALLNMLSNWTEKQLDTRRKADYEKRYGADRERLLREIQGDDGYGIFDKELYK